MQGTCPCCYRPPFDLSQLRVSGTEVDNHFEIKEIKEIKVSNPVRAGIEQVPSSKHKQIKYLLDF
jgi:hypothetical protein